ncbi:MAG: hypothetical protein KF897_15585 [Opitutaceae bacterium]|nr:hypothetical protein [Opitutaceae bacterium]
MPPAGHAAASRPGFHLSATAPAGFELVPEPLPVTADHEAGYYVFLGCGDYPIITGKETHALAAWTLDQWRDLVSWMGRHGMNRLWVLLNGYTLAYPSERYPELRDQHARNVRENFLGDLIDHAHRAGVQVYLMLTTDGHGRDFCRLHPEAVRRQADGSPGAHFGLCLEHPATQRYLDDILTEVLTLYPQADGLAVHPTESDPERFNPESATAFARETGLDLATATPAERHAWYNRTYARFLHRFFSAARRLRPGLNCVMANCWWQDDQPDIYRAELPADTRIAVWHYEWGATSAAPWSLHQWRRHFPADRLIYMPTSQSYLCPTEPDQVLARHCGTDRLISTALAHGVQNTLYFAGWDILDEPARLLDSLLARHPTLRLAPESERQALVPALYADYAGTRARLLGSGNIVQM